jgi:hypothetical protein
MCHRGGLRGGGWGGVVWAPVRPLRRLAGRGVELAASAQVRARALHSRCHVVQSISCAANESDEGRRPASPRGALGVRTQQSETSVGVIDWMTENGMPPAVRAPSLGGASVCRDVEARHLKNRDAHPSSPLRPAPGNKTLTILGAKAG